MDIYNGTYCVYIHTNKINGKKYVGQTVHGDHPKKKRWVNGLGYQSQTYFWRAIKKYGWDNFDYEIVASRLTKEEADNFEKILIKLLNTTDRSFGYNVSLGGDGTCGVNPTDEQIQKRKNTMRKYFDDPTYIQMMRNVANKKNQYGNFLRMASFYSHIQAQRRQSDKLVF